MKKLISLFSFVALFSALSFGQTALPSTTLSAAIDSKSTFIPVASASGINAYPNNTALYIDRELIVVNAVNGTTLQVQRGAGGTKATSHVSGATAYVGANGGAYFSNFGNVGACTAGNEIYLPQPVVSITSPLNGYKRDCFGGLWQFDLNLPLYTFTVAPQAQRAATSPSAGNVVSLTAQAGGAQSGTTSSGGAGGASSLTGGVGGIGGSSSGTAGAGGAASVTGGAGGAGPITGGVGGAVSVVAGAGGNGSSAGGTGGALTLGSGAAGTGGTGTVGAVAIKQGSTTIFNATAGGVVTAVGMPRLQYCGPTTGTAACANTATALTGEMYAGLATLASNSAVITFGTAFTSTSTYNCVANDTTTRANPVQMVATTSATATITNTTGAADVISYICTGY